MDAETPSLSEEEITELISDPAKISTHEIALEVLDCLDSEIADIQAKIDAAQIRSNAKPLDAEGENWLRRASYAAAMRRNERHRVMQRDKEIRGTKNAAQQKPRMDPEAQRMKQARLLAETEARRDAKRLELEKQRTLQMELTARKRGRFNMSFVQRELDKIAIELRKHPSDTKEYQELYLAQQALVWATDPECYKSPFNLVMGIESTSEPSPPKSAD